MPATPDLLWLGQSLPVAIHSCTGSPYQSYVGLSPGIATSAYVDCSTAFSVTGAASLRRGANASFLDPSTFHLTDPGRRYEPLYDD